MVLGLIVASGCSTSGSDSASSAPSTSPSPTLDLSRLAEVGDDFPPSFTPTPPAGPKTVTPRDAQLISDAVSYGKPLTVAPPECRPLFKPVAAQAGAEKMGVGAGGPQPPALVVSAVSPVAVPDPLPTRGCDRMTFTVAGAVPDGTAERLAAPHIEGATTNGLKVLFDGGVEYFYTAILDGRTYVEVWCRVGPDFQAEPVLPDLLTKAVAAIRQ
nr:DUF5642 family protein [Mycobacterium sp. E740]